MKYAFLGESSILPIIISTALNKEEEDKLLWVLRAHKLAFRLSLASSQVFGEHLVEMSS